MDSNGNLPLLDLIAAESLHFQEPDSRRFPCLDLGRAALEQGGMMPCALNAADEVAVEAFLRREIIFPDIPHLIEKVMRGTPGSHLNSIEDVLECDREARLLARQSLGSMAHPHTVV